jgi:hypothetical protein
LTLAATIATHAATLVWTNSSGGNWNLAANWEPNQVPGAADTAILTNAGTCTVTISADAVIASIILGGITSTQTLSLPFPDVTLTLNSALTVHPNSQVIGEGRLAIHGGDVRLDGMVQNLLWTGGRLVMSWLTIATNGTLTVDGSAEKGLVFSMLINAGTVRWTGTGNLRAKFDIGYGPRQVVVITNLPGALFDFQSDTDLLYDNGGFPLFFGFFNGGTLRKSASVATNTFASPIEFISTGQVDVQGGTFSFSGNFTQTGGALSFAVQSGLPDYAPLNVAGQANLSGVIKSSVTGLVGAGARIKVLTFGSCHRGPVAFAGRNLGGGLVWDPEWGPHSLTLAVRSANHPTHSLLSLAYCRGWPASVLVEGPTDSTFCFEASTNLVAWTALETNSAPEGVWEFCDENAPSLAQRFYRVRQP